jgi:hypothetical protein
VQFFVMLLGMIPLSALHELFHVLAGRRLGLPTRLAVSNRLTFVVFETRLNGLHSVPRSRRYLPLLAGMLGDVLIVCLLGVVADLTRGGDGSLSLGGRYCLALAFTTVTRIGWQFLLYLRTDLSYVLATALNCHDLHDASKAMLVNRVWRLLGKPHRQVDEEQWTRTDRRIGTWYGVVIGTGLCAGLSLTAFVSVPVLFIYLTRAVENISLGYRTELFWDSLLSVSLMIVQFALPGYLARRKRRQNVHRKPRLLTVTE